MSSQLLPSKSSAANVVLGGFLDFNDFVPIFGPGGGRMVIRHLVIRVQGTITVAGALWDGRDAWRLFSLINVENKTNKQRWTLDGAMSRNASVMFQGTDNHVENASVAIGASQVVDFEFVIPFEKRYAKNPKDFCLPADRMKKIGLTFNSLAQCVSGATVLSAPALSCYVFAVTDEEFSLEHKLEDSVSSTDFTSPVSGRLSLNGVLFDMFIAKKGQTIAGSELTAGITDVRCEDLGTSTIPVRDLRTIYRLDRKLGNTGVSAIGAEVRSDPVFEGKVIPVFVSDDNQSFADGRMADQLKFDFGGAGLVNGTMVIRQLLPNDKDAIRATNALYGVGDVPLLVKTKGKTKTKVQNWSLKELNFAPMKSPLPRM